MKKVLAIGLWVCALSFTCNAGGAQDSLYVQSPAKVTLRAALLPGWGQITNRAYWKVPVVWGGIGFMVYQTSQTADLYLTYRNAYRDRTDGDPNTVDPFVGKDTEASLIQKRDLLRRSRDAYVLLSLAAYALQILDAHVDAHLKAFDRLDFSVVPATPPSRIPLNPWAGFSTAHAEPKGYPITVSLRYRF
ncbi:MAG: DUF5683 domain-containing protein [Bacteroidota bacterium]